MSLAFGFMCEGDKGHPHRAEGSCIRCSFDSPALRDLTLLSSRNNVRATRPKHALMFETAKLKSVIKTNLSAFSLRAHRYRPDPYSLRLLVTLLLFFLCL